jgi:hypothetical protein
MSADRKAQPRRRPDVTAVRDIAYAAEMLERELKKLSPNYDFVAIYLDAIEGNVTRLRQVTVRH